MAISKHNAPHYTWGGDCDGWLLLQGADLAVIHERMPAGRSEARHYHVKARQFFFVLSGTLSMDLAGVMMEVPTGTGLHVQPFAPHKAINASGEDVEFLVISHPSTRGDRVDL